MEKLRKLALSIGSLALLILIFGILTDDQEIWRPAAIGSAIALSIGIGAIKTLKGYQYTAWIITAVVCGMTYPDAFLQIGSIDLRNKWLILLIIQMVMFGMGMKMSIKDFTGIGKTGKGIAVGLMSHFTVMPLMGFLLTKIFHFEMEIAAGIILIGCCSS